MKKLLCLIAVSAFFLVACTEAEYPIPENELIEIPKYEGGDIEFPKYSTEQ